MASSRTKVVVALGMLDIVRQVAHAWSAKAEADRDRTGFGRGLAEDARRLARDAREHVPSRSELEWALPPWRRTPTPAARVRSWAPIAAIIAVSGAAIVLTARIVASRDAQLDPTETVTDSRVVGAIRAGSQAIDAGVGKVVEGSSAAAVGTAAALAAGSTAVRHATVDAARHELDERVIAPAKRKAITFGTLGILGLTLYVIVIATAVQLVVGAIG